MSPLFSVKHMQWNFSQLHKGRSGVEILTDLVLKGLFLPKHPSFRVKTTYFSWLIWIKAPICFPFRSIGFNRWMIWLARFNTWWVSGCVGAEKTQCLNLQYAHCFHHTATYHRTTPAHFWNIALIKSCIGRVSWPIELDDTHIFSN